MSKAQLVPITWHRVRITGWVDHQRSRDMRRWCQEHAGVDRADWEYQPAHRCWRFRSEEIAVLFQLTWG